ncbi:MAG: ParB/RepB/Spo0J family partition protein, partial [Phycisphaeraceae bacterium]|nr:ParB/RepB/Spo0J family partition protein [Phycisphaeraceae bacterium]
EAGVMQPIVVRRAGNGYQLVAGERRWRAARKAGLDRVPAVIHDLSDAETAQWALVENLQREDLDPIERARAFEHLAQEFDWTHGQIAEQIGVSRAAVSNSLRLLSLPDEIRELIQAGSLSEGQAKVLAGIDTPARQLKLARRAADEGWSVRALENAAKPARPEGDGGGAESSGGSDSSSRPPQLVDLERQISEQLQTKVQLKTGRKKGSGSLTIKFYSLDQFDGLLERLGVETD